MLKRNKLYLVGGLLTLVLISSAFKETDRFEIVKSLDIFSDLFKEINSLYVEDIQAEDLIKSGIDGMLENLDPYTVYYPESEIEDYKLMTTGQYGGIGARIKKIDDYLTIRQIFENSPSMKAELIPGDKILEVDGNKIKDQSSYELSKLLKGTPGTEVKIKVKRVGVEKEIEKVFKREEIKISSVPFYGMLDEEVGYIKLTSFTRKVSNEVKQAFMDLKNNQNMKKLVFDLRGNPGGLLMESINIVNMFVPKGEVVVETRGKIENWNKQYKSLNKPQDLEIPIVVLVDKGSASASEIVSGSLQDFDRALVLGKNTYGKGLVQTTVKLKYNSSLKVTTAKYYIPSGRCIQEVNYGKKDKYGRGIKKADSLRVKFKTKNGREVEDGHGIQPDIELGKEKLNYITKSILKKNHIFHFVNEYVLGIDSIDRPEKFVVTDEVFNMFIAYLKKQEHLFTSATEKKIQSVIDKSEEEKLDQYVVEDLQKVKEKLNQNKIEEIIKNKVQLKEALKLEIVGRFYYRKGKIESGLSSDLVIEKALKLINDSTLYESYLLNSND